MAKFADDTKISGVSTKYENCLALQSDLDKITKWCENWDMSLNYEKCTSLHIGNNNVNFTYTMNDKLLNKAIEQKDLGVIIDNKLKFSKHCKESSKKANKILGLVSRSFEHKSKDIILPLYKSLVRPHLEYASQFWNPHYRKDIDVLERVQKRATKQIPSVRNLPYSERLRALKIHSLETRRLRGQLIEVYKIINGFDLLGDNILTVDRNSITRNNGLKLKGKRFHTDVAKNFFANRVINEWNKLPHEVVHAPSINSFKNRLDKYFHICNIW